MIRQIIHIDEEKCNGCGLCASACHEGAIDIVDGKAKLMRENFCDGFGDCLPGCPTGAISFEEREAPEYDEQAVKQAQEAKKMEEIRRLTSTSSNSVMVVGWLLMKSCRSWIRRICSSLTTLSTSACFRISRHRCRILR